MLTMRDAGAEAVLQPLLMFASTDVDEVRRKVAGALTEHRLDPRGSTLDAQLHGTKTDRVQVYRLQYGGPVSVHTRLADDCVMIQCGLRGSVRIRSDHGDWQVLAGDGIILAPGSALNLEWEAGSTQLLVKIALPHLDRAYENLTGAPPVQPHRFDQSIAAGTPAGTAWNTLLDYFCSQAYSAAAWPSSPAARVAEQVLIGHLLCHHLLAPTDGAWQLPRNIAPKYVRRAREFMEARVQDAISLDDIASYAGVSVRSLSRAFQDQYNTSPMTGLRALRLDRIREDLKKSDADCNVAEIAFRWGYSHLGRFAAAYRERFGEAPSQTLRKSRHLTQGKRLAHLERSGASGNIPIHG